MSRERNFYFIRSRKDDSIVAVGTATECIKQMGFASMNSFNSMVSKNRAGVKQTYEIDIESIDEEDESC